MISIISAMAQNRVIGNKNALPWHLPADFKWFVENTRGKSIVMGLKTFKSIREMPLPNRRNIVLTRDLKYKGPPNCFIAHSINEVLELTKNEKEVMICGGALIYEQFLPMANRIYLTLISKNFIGDTYFPVLKKDDWIEIRRKDNQPDKKNLYWYSFLIFERNK